MSKEVKETPIVKLFKLKVIISCLNEMKRWINNYHKYSLAQTDEELRKKHYKTVSMSEEERNRYLKKQNDTLFAKRFKLANMNAFFGFFLTLSILGLIACCVCLFLRLVITILPYNFDVLYLPLAIFGFLTILFFILYKIVSVKRVTMYTTIRENKEEIKKDKQTNSYLIENQDNFQWDRKVIEETTKELEDKYLCVTIFFNRELSKIIDKENFKYLDIMIYLLKNNKCDSIEDALKIAKKPNIKEKLFCDASGVINNDKIRELYDANFLSSIGCDAIIDEFVSKLNIMFKNKNIIFIDDDIFVFLKTTINFGYDIEYLLVEHTGAL